ncbi:MAG: methylamine dehydrogenase light chain [bacterium]
MEERNWIDKRVERLSRVVARGTSRRGFIGRVGAMLVGAATLPLLPVARGHANDLELPDDATIEGNAGNPESCEYWRNCAIDGFLCTCCGGSTTTCPPGTEMSPITWIGTCRNPADGKDYILSYNDCCGSALCMRCQCLRTEDEKPPYVMWKNNDMLWCFGTKSRAVTCSVSIVLGPADGA